MSQRATTAVDTPPLARKPLRAFARSLTRAERRGLGRMATSILVLHLVGFGLLFGLVAPRHFRLGDGHHFFTVGVGVLAYTFGLRHAFDADHIAAVDNTTRKLIGDNLARRADGDDRGRKPLSVGFWFSLGHSTIVFALAAFLAVGVKSLVGPVESDSSRLHAITGIVGPVVSGAFLWVLGIVNLAALLGIIRIFREMRTGRFDEAELEKRLESRGAINRVLGGLTKSVTKPWQSYPIGLLFGLGFDTATEVGLLVLAGGAAAFDLPIYAILVLPLLFAAGMCLADTGDGVLMNAAYGWAFAHPVRKVFYNLTITAISVIVALAIGSVELAGVIADQLSVTSGPLAAIASIDLAHAGYAIVGLFAGSWLVALGIWRLGRIEERWLPSEFGPDHVTGPRSTATPPKGPRPIGSVAERLGEATVVAAPGPAARRPRGAQLGGAPGWTGGPGAGPVDRQTRRQWHRGTHEG
ncbi:nickel transporter [Intrasporangium oryzae NRRL B-24470]|uniref:Nickel/cobalt efflux system n=1 Tax=Intrasporangium oryzae NRRL B-24470 TaxID=1386089 RepID=W9GBX7_9MICO|nr:nickel transporter [Intrasporangium oryzae NRRL B-24470]